MLRVAFDLRGTQSAGVFLKGGIARWIEGLGSALLDRDDVDLVGIADPLLELTETGQAFAARGRLCRPAEAGSLDVDVHHVTSPFEAMRRIDLVPSGLSRPEVARVATLYDVIPLVPDLPYPEALRRWWKRRAQVVVDASVVLCLSRVSATEGIERLGVNSDRMRVVGTGVPRHVTGRCHEPLPVGVREPFVLYTGGSADGRKNVAGLIAAFGLLPSELRASHQVVVASWSPPEMRSSLERAADEAGVAEQVRLCGWVEDKVLATLLARCVALVYPSLHEGFGYPILEAMASGVPVIASSTTGCGEVLGHPRAAFDPYDRASIASTLELVLGDEALRRSLVDFGAERVRSFTWEATAERVVGAYRDAAATVSKRPLGRRSGVPRAAVLATLTEPAVGTSSRALLTAAEAMSTSARVAFGGFRSSVPWLGLGRFPASALGRGAPAFPGPVACLVDSPAAARWAASALKIRPGIAILWDLDAVLGDPAALRELHSASGALVVRDRFDAERVMRVLGPASAETIHLVRPPLAWHACPVTSALVPAADLGAYGGGATREEHCAARRLPLICLLRPAQLGPFCPGGVEQAAHLCELLASTGNPAIVRLAGALPDGEVQAARRAYGGQLPPRLIIGSAPGLADLLALSTAASVHVSPGATSRSASESLVDLALTARRPIVVVGSPGDPHPSVIRLRNDAGADALVNAVLGLLASAPVAVEESRRPAAVAMRLLELMEARSGSLSQRASGPVL